MESQTLPAIVPPPATELGIIDANTGKVLSLFTLNAEVLPKGDDAYPLIPALENLIRDAKIALVRLEMVVQDDLKKRGATTRFLNGRTYALKTTKQYQVDEPILYRKLRILHESGELSEKDFNDAISEVAGAVTYKVDNGVLNRLAELGGEVRAAIKAHQHSSDRQSLVVKK